MASDGTDGTSPSVSPGSKPLARPAPSPQTSASSVHSSQDGKFSLPPSSIPSSVDVRPTNADHVTTAATPAPKKPGFSSRLSRMFSHRGGDLPTIHNDANASDIESNPESAPPPAQRQNSVVATLKSQPNGNPESKSPSVNGAAEKKPETAGLPLKRFTVAEDGTHEHLLKSDKRQEKLTDLFKNMLGKKKEGQVEDHQLSLVSNWVDQLKSEKLANDQRGGPNCASTLVEKYGKCQEVVGRGAFGIVRISHKPDDKDPKREQLYAVKEFRRRPSESPKKYNKRLTSEFCISSALRHPNVIHTLDLMKDAKGDFCEVMEYCAGGDLYTLVLAAGKLEVLEADCYFKQLMRGVEYIHEMGVSHRDLKPENLLLTTRGALKITDFGNGECFRMAWEKEAHMVAGLCGSAPYIAPEEYIDQEFDPRAVDIWACGVIYMAMRTGRHLWRVAKKDEDEFYERYLEGRRDEDGYAPIETLHRARCRNVIYSILDPNPGRRITGSQVLKSEWGRGIQLCRAGEEGF